MDIIPVKKSRVCVLVSHRTHAGVLCVGDQGLCCGAALAGYRLADSSVYAGVHRGVLRLL